MSFRFRIEIDTDNESLRDGLQEEIVTNLHDHLAFQQECGDDEYTFKVKIDTDKATLIYDSIRNKGFDPLRVFLKRGKTNA